MEEVKPEIKGEVYLTAIVDSTSDVARLNVIEEEFSLSEPHSYVCVEHIVETHDNTNIQSLDLQTKSEVLDSSIENVSDDINIKLERLEREEVHIKDEVDDRHVDQIIQTQVEQISCDLCNSKFTSQTSLQQHLKLHTEEQLFQCNICDYTSVRKSNLQRHIKTHTIEKPFQCSGTLEPNAVNNIIKTSISYKDKLIIKNLGAPRPDLIIVQQDKRKGTEFNRKFNKAMYNSSNWLCGCDIRNAFFCFVCILNDSNLTDAAWTKIGVTDLKHLGEKIKKHTISTRHLHNEIEFAMLGRLTIHTQLYPAYRLSIKQHNEQVKKNRYVLNKIIDSIKFCGAFELALCGQDETVKSTNTGIFKGLINLQSEVEDILKGHLNSSGAFMDPSKTIQNDILDAILHVCRDIIKSEIESTDFLALQADETIDSAHKQQTVLIYRYELKGQIYERFWGFFCPENCTAEGLSAVILEQCQIINIDKTPNKLISQSYDGASVIRGNTGGVQAKVKNVYEQAHFIHCYSHQLNLILEKAANQNKKAKIFFANLGGFAAYFSRTAARNRTGILKNFMDKQIPSRFSSTCNFHTATISTVYTQKDILIECFNEIIDKETDKTMTRKTIALKNMLNDADFIFWLNFFNDVIPHVDVLCRQLQQTKIDSLKVKTYMLAFKKNMQIVRGRIDMMPNTMPTSSKRPRMEDGNSMAAKEVCDIIITCSEDRFEFSDYLTLALLLCPEMFPKYRCGFPETTFRMATTVYSFPESNKLKQELLVLYNRKDFSTFTSALSLLQMFNENDLVDAFSETVKLIKIVCTIPMITMESERSVSTMKKIKTFLRSTMSQDGLSALAMCSIEKDLIQNTPDFNARVIEHFSNQKERNAEFIYKCHK